MHDNCAQPRPIRHLRVTTRACPTPITTLLISIATRCRSTLLLRSPAPWVVAASCAAARPKALSGPADCSVTESSYDEDAKAVVVAGVRRRRKVVDPASLSSRHRVSTSQGRTESRAPSEHDDSPSDLNSERLAAPSSATLPTDAALPLRRRVPRNWLPDADAAPAARSGDDQPTQSEPNVRRRLGRKLAQTPGSDAVDSVATSAGMCPPGSSNSVAATTDLGTHGSSDGGSGRESTRAGSSSTCFGSSGTGASAFLAQRTSEVRAERQDAPVLKGTANRRKPVRQSLTPGPSAVADPASATSDNTSVTTIITAVASADTTTASAASRRPASSMAAAAVTAPAAMRHALGVRELSAAVAAPAAAQPSASPSPPTMKPDEQMSFPAAPPALTPAPRGASVAPRPTALRTVVATTPGENLASATARGQPKISGLGTESGLEGTLRAPRGPGIARSAAVARDSDRPPASRLRRQPPNSNPPANADREEHPKSSTSGQADSLGPNPLADHQLRTSIPVSPGAHKSPGAHPGHKARVLQTIRRQSSGNARPSVSDLAGSSGFRSAGAAAGAATNGSRSRGCAAQGASSWAGLCAKIDMQATYPDLRSFAAAVQAQAMNWHPRIISAALNHAAQFYDSLLVRGGGSEASKALLMRLTRQLQVALMPHMPSMSKPRYAVNAMWVCAKMGLWGDERHDFLQALLRRLREPRDGVPCAILRGAPGQSHGNLWWALSEYDALRQQEAEAAAGDDEASARGASTTVPRVGQDGVLDLLVASAAFIKEQEVLDPVSYKPQEHANILLASVRLGYTSDHALVAHLMQHFLLHKGPFKPQAISNVMYALGLLYAVEEDVETGRLAPAVVNNDDDDDEEEDGGLAAARWQSEGALPPECAAHMRGLVTLALRSGLSSFKAQELSNMAYACARLGLQLPSHRRWGAGPPPAGPEGLSPRNYPTERPEGVLPEDPTEAVRAFVVWLAHHVLQRLEENPRQFTPQGINNIAWALSTMLYQNASFFTTVIDAVLNTSCMNQGKPQEWMNFLFSLSNVKCRPPLAIMRVMRLSLKGAQLPLDTRSWSTLLCSMGSLDLYDEASMAIVTASAFRTGCKDMLGEGLANSLWGLALMSPGTMTRHADVVNLLVEEIERRGPASMDSVMLMQLWQVHLELEAATSEAKSCLEAPPTVAAAAAFRTVDSRGRGRVAAVRLRPGLSSTDGSSGRGTGSGSGSAVLRPAAGGNRALRAAPGERSRRASAASAEAQPHELVRLRTLSPGLVAAAREAVLNVKTRTRSSDLQRDVTRTLQQMMAATAHLTERDTDEIGNGNASGSEQEGFGDGFRGGADDEVEVHGCSRVASVAAQAPSLVPQQHRRRGGAGGDTDVDAAGPSGAEFGGVTITRLEQEWLVEPLTIRVDLCVWLSDGRQVAIEVDGPSHYFLNDPRTQDVRARLRDRQLARVLGAENVKTVPYFAWDRYGTPEAKRAYLSRELQLNGRGSTWHSAGKRAQ